MSKPGNVVLAVGVDERRNIGKALVGLVVVDDNHVSAQRAGDSKRVDAGRAAVDGDDELRALRDEACDGFGIGAIALGHSVGDIDARVEPMGLKEALDEGG